MARTPLSFGRSKYNRVKCNGSKLLSVLIVMMFLQEQEVKITELCVECYYQAYNSPSLRNLNS